MIVQMLARKLPRRYVAGPRVHSGAFLEGDEATDANDGADSTSPVAIVVWEPPERALSIATDLPAQDEYEVRVYDSRRGRRLVAAVEIVSPANKDRPEHRRAFVAKCAALLQQRVSVTIVDLVTARNFNLYAELLETIGAADPEAAACQPLRQERPPSGQPAGDRPFRTAEFSGGLLAPLALQVAQDDGRPVAFGKCGQLPIKHLPQVVASRGRRLHPRGGPRLLRTPPGHRSPSLQGRPVGHTVQPGPEARPLVDRRRPADEDEEGGLEGVLGVVIVAQDATADPEHHRAVA
jgi:hypothetical protein